MERMALLSVLPVEGNIVTLRIIRDLRMGLAPTEAEHKTLKISETVNGTKWDTRAGLVETEITVGEKATDIIIEALNKANDEKKLTEQHVSVYEKFIKV